VSKSRWPDNNRGMIRRASQDPLVSLQIGVLLGASVGIHKVRGNEDASEVAD
jgi:hypothetical protein